MSTFYRRRLVGRVEHGEHRGRELGFPTANLYFPAGAITPPDGVYGGFARCAGERSILGVTAVSVGTNPTFGQLPRRLEAHIIGFDGDLYGKLLEIDLCLYLRGMVAYTGEAALIDQIAVDVDRCLAMAPAFNPFGTDPALLRPA